MYLGWSSQVDDTIQLNILAKLAVKPAVPVLVHRPFCLIQALALIEVGCEDVPGKQGEFMHQGFQKKGQEEERQWAAQSLCYSHLSIHISQCTQWHHQRTMMSLMITVTFSIKLWNLGCRSSLECMEYWCSYQYIRCWSVCSVIQQKSNWV